MSDKRYYVRVRGKVLGPFGMPQLRSLRDRGQLSSFHEISEDRQGWASAASLDELFAGDGRRAASGSRPDVFSEAEGVREPPGGEKWRYVAADGQEQGPVTRAGLLRLHQSGAINDGTQVWQEGMAEWLPFAASGISPPGQRAVAGHVLTALDALPLFLTDPVGSLPRLCTELRPGAAFGLGVVFYLFAVLAGFLGMVLAAELDGFPVLRDVFTIRRTAVRAEIILKLLALAAMPFLSLAGAVSLVRLVTRCRGSLGSDTLIAGATWLPLGLAMPILALLGRNFELVWFLSLVLSVLPVLLLNSVLTRGMQLSDRGAIFAIPMILVVSIYLCKVIFVALFGHVGDIPSVQNFGPF
jgi:hypothetical protein